MTEAIDYSEEQNPDYNEALDIVVADINNCIGALHELPKYASGWRQSEETAFDQAGWHVWKELRLGGSPRRTLRAVVWLDLEVNQPSIQIKVVEGGE